MTGLTPSDLVMLGVVLLLAAAAGGFAVFVALTFRREPGCDVPGCDEPGIWSHLDGGPGAVCMRHVVDEAGR